ncbi:MAG: EAL domain-containing protein, partial [Chloroflexi bacterium]|nr:EAL domain-containing protein [Chloroflexota bacterium]
MHHRSGSNKDCRRHPFQSKGDIDFEFSFAFQPIFNYRTRGIDSFEALIRGPRGEPAASVLNRVSSENISSFDEISRWKAIEMARRLHVPNRLNINLSARGLFQVDLNITATFKASLNIGFPVQNIIFEITESESLTDSKTLVRNIKLLQEFGFMTAIDDFGMGYSGLKLLLEYQPNFIKLDRHLISNIDQDSVKQSIFSGIRRMCEKLSIDLVAEGVERAGEYAWLSNSGVQFFQGYYFAP